MLRGFENAEFEARTAKAQAKLASQDLAEVAAND